MQDDRPALHHPSPQRQVLLAGATGLVGLELLRGLLADESVAQVLAVGRRAPPLTHRKLHFMATDFRALHLDARIDEVYLALGTTIKVAGSQAAFRAVDFGANIAAAQAARAMGARRCGLVSAMGADAGSRIFYNRVKGELEDALRGMGFEALVIARPSFLVGDREALGQPVRPGEGWALAASRVLGPVIPANLKPIAAARVAGALLTRVPVATGMQTLRSGALQAF